MVARRAYFRCAGRSCRFLSFVEGSPQVQAISWMRLQTAASKSVAKVALGQQQHLVVLGQDGFRPEDARLGPESEALGDVCFIDALAALTERPAALETLLPDVSLSARVAGGCHEVRLCIAGEWRAFLIDERLPVASVASAGITARNAHEALAFGRSAGNQLWLPLIEKAYSKAFGCYQFALPGTSLPEVLADLTGAPVEHVLLGRQSRSSSGRSLDESELWEWLRLHHCRGSLMVCSSRVHVQTEQPSVHAVLDIVEAGENSRIIHGSHCRAVRLRNPRAGPLNMDSSSYHTILATLRGVPAEASTYGDGSFWVRFPNDFLATFSHVDVCHAFKTGGSLAHTRSFVGEFAPGKSLGVRGCALRFRLEDSAAESAEVWLTLFQPVPQGTRLLHPACGHVLNDIGLVVFNSKTEEPCAFALGGAAPSFSCQIQLDPGNEYLALPFSFRAWQGPLCFRLQASAPLAVQPATPGAACASERLLDQFAHMVWSATLSLAADAAKQCREDRGPFCSENLEATGSLQSVLRGGIRRPPRCSVHALPVLGDGECRYPGAELFLLELDGGALGIVRNPHTAHALLVEGVLEANLVATLTSRGAQFGEWCRERNDDAQGQKPEWRRYALEDVIPPMSQQLVCVHTAISSENWAVEVQQLRASLVPSATAGARPVGHPFAPQPLDALSGEAGSIEALQVRSNSPLTWEGSDDDELRLAIEMSLESAKATCRWARRRNRRPGSQGTCVICTEPVSSPSPLTCCSRQVCLSCAACWAREQESQGLGAEEMSCPACAQLLGDSNASSILAELLSPQALARARARSRRTLPLQPPLASEQGLSAGLLASLGLKQCPGCGEGLQKETETCHKMICRSCRARFCFRCLTRLEYFNCSCTGAEHNFVDPVDGRILAHQRS
eukprot:TRINITY_DN27948_c0_g1_i1.p1 TRINITY_DN27948_c0_g1~~TRINITY_DN27948_c0_g1_i1.p1  ORF type:complete len:1057 (-),score=181.99 TRINITY_DN27948_c0_g1_i1:33-2741(-)